MFLRGRVVVVCGPEKLFFSDVQLRCLLQRMLRAIAGQKCDLRNSSPEIRILPPTFYCGLVAKLVFHALHPEKGLEIWISRLTNCIREVVQSLKVFHFF